MADEPDDCETERDHENQKNNPAFPPLFAQGNAAAAAAAIVRPALVLERDRNIEPATAFAGAGQQFLSLAARSFLGHARRFRDHAFEFFHFAAQLRFALGEFFLLLVERRPGFRRSAAHAKSLRLRGHPEKNQKRHDPKNNQRQRDREADLQPLGERFSAADSRKT
jgi:hypothetical protein